MLIGWDNKIDAGSVSAGSELSTLPSSNVQNEHVSKKWSTAAAVNSSYLVFDLGSSLSCALLALLGTNLTSSATIRLRGSVTDPAATSSLAYDSGSVSAGVVSGYGASYKSFTAVASRYWRLDVEDLTLTGNLMVGRVFLGPKWTTTVPQLFDWSVTMVDPSRRVRAYGGQVHSDVLPKFRRLDFVIDFHTEAEMYGNAMALALANGLTGDVLAVPDIAGSYLSQQAVWGLLSASEPLVHRQAQIYRQKFSIEERL